MTRVILAAGMILGIGPAALGDDAAVEAERARLKGTWRVVSLEQHGRAVPAEEFSDDRLVFAGDTWTRPGKEPARNRFDIDPTARPRTIDFRVLHGPKRAEFVFPGIYELEGDTLKICTGRQGMRPTGFSTAPENFQSLQVLKREAD